METHVILSTDQDGKNIQHVHFLGADNMQVCLCASVFVSFRIRILGVDLDWEMHFPHSFFSLICCAYICIQHWQGLYSDQESTQPGGRCAHRLRNEWTAYSLATWVSCVLILQLSSLVFY